MPISSRDICLAGVLTFLQSASSNPAPGPAGGPPLAWSSVSIHESAPDDQVQNYSRDQPDGITDRGMSLREIISESYHFGVMPFRDDEITGLPDWALKTRYDITARVAPEDVAAFTKLSDLSMQETIAAFAAKQPTGEMLMVQNLLKDRFHLQVHWEAKERSVFTLTVAKGGVRMKPAADPKHGEMNFSEGKYSGKGVPASFLANLLEIPAQRTVIDKTGLDGVYDFELHFAGRNNPADAETSEPDFFTAVQEQLGLKLQSARAPVPVLVVDHIERPTPN